MKNIFLKVKWIWVLQNVRVSLGSGYVEYLWYSGIVFCFYVFHFNCWSLPLCFAWFFLDIPVHGRSENIMGPVGSNTFYVFLVVFSAHFSTWWKSLVLVNDQASLCIFSINDCSEEQPFLNNMVFCKMMLSKTGVIHDLLRWYWRHISCAQQTYALILCFGVFNCFKYLLLDLCFTHLIYMVYFSFCEQIDNQTDSLPHWISFIYSLWTWLKSCQT